VKIVTLIVPPVPVQNSINAQLVLQDNTNIKKILVTPIVLTVCSLIHQTLNVSIVMPHAQNVMALVPQVVLNANPISIIRLLEMVNLMANVSPNVLLPSTEIPHSDALKIAPLEPTMMMIQENV